MKPPQQLASLPITADSRTVGIAPESRTSKTLADRLVVSLAEQGIDTYFGVPGGAIEPLFDAVARARARGLAHMVPMRSEAGAAFAADGHYRETGRIAACLVTTGPGVSNLLTATMSAEADRVPLLILTPQVALHKEGRGALQDSSMDGHDLARALAGCTRYSSLVSHPDQLSYKLARALARARGAPTGPVHLSLPSDILRAPAGAGALLSLPVHAPPRALDWAALEQLASALFAARAPLFYVGDDAGHGMCSLFTLASALGAAVVSSPAGKRWVGHHEPRYRGVLGFSGHDAAQRAARRADLVVAFGATFDELSTNAWTVFPEVPLYAIDEHDRFAYRFPQARVVVGGARDVLTELSRRLPAEPAMTPAPPSQIRMRGAESGQGAVHPAALMRWLSEALPADVVVHVDAGNSFSWSTRDLLRPRPDTYRVAMGLSTMCWAISAVIGACVGRRRRTLCVTGDGSMLMSSLELTVAVEQQLPVTYVVLNDSGLGMVRHGQLLGGAEPIAHEITPVRFDELARACGAAGRRVESQAELESLERGWLASDEGGPCVIDVNIDREAVPPMADRVRGLAAGVPK